MRRKIVRTDAFEESVAALRDSQETRLVLRMLIARVRRWPHAGELIPGSAARVIRSLPYDDFPAIRLIYRVSGPLIYLYRADHYDVLAELPRGSA
ncbi:MAG TPA: hypothetical protein VEU30_12685 [Thermoanaerobaculia bacterium]|nr:hypothetical protein [Thermoanaerobaculia bacterium]